MSLWVRNVSGAAPRVCLWQVPIRTCVTMSPMPQDAARSRWYHYQAIATPDPGTRALRLFLYAATYGEPSVNDYAHVVVRRSPVLPQPVVIASRRGRDRPAPDLITSGQSFSTDWIGPPEARHVEVDGLRNGWLVPHATDVPPPRFAPSSWYLQSRLVSLLAAVALIALALSSWRRGRRRQAVTALSASEER